jgi:hypothetical protein
MFSRSLFVLLFFFFWPLCCLSFFDLQILITRLVSSNSFWNCSDSVIFLSVLLSVISLFSTYLLHCFCFVFHDYVFCTISSNLNLTLMIKLNTYTVHYLKNILICLDLKRIVLRFHWSDILIEKITKQNKTTKTNINHLWRSSEFCKGICF